MSRENCAHGRPWSLAAPPCPECVNEVEDFISRGAEARKAHEADTPAGRLSRASVAMSQAAKAYRAAQDEYRAAYKAATGQDYQPQILRNDSQPKSEEETR